MIYSRSTIWVVNFSFILGNVLAGCLTTPSKYFDGHTKRLMKKNCRIHIDHINIFETFFPRKAVCAMELTLILKFWVLILFLKLQCFKISRNLFNPCFVINSGWLMHKPHIGAKAQSRNKAAGSISSDIRSSLPLKDSWRYLKKKKKERGDWEIQQPRWWKTIGAAYRHMVHRECTKYVLIRKLKLVFK